MSKNIALLVLAGTAITTSVFGYFQLQKAEENRMLAEQYRGLAEKAEKIALQQKAEADRQRALAMEAMRMAEANAAEALRQQKLAEAELTRLKKSK